MNRILEASRAAGSPSPCWAWGCSRLPCSIRLSGHRSLPSGPAPGSGSGRPFDGYMGTAYAGVPRLIHRREVGPQVTGKPPRGRERVGSGWPSTGIPCRESEFPVTRRWAYFDHAARPPFPVAQGERFAPGPPNKRLTASSAGPHANCALRRFATGPLAAERSPRRDRLHPQHDARHRFDRRGISLAARRQRGHCRRGVPFQYLPWLNLESRGVSLRQVESREGRIGWTTWQPRSIDRPACSRSATLSSPPVSGTTWTRLVELCQARGSRLFVDAIQGLGPHTIDVRRTPLDFLAADGQVAARARGCGNPLRPPRLD